jgi:EAL domain-containing protein (putative c-di-GMP-specific phosphodiesterase class I)
VVAEGIEEHSQLRTLEAMGCQLAQGFMLGRPGSADEIDGLSGWRTLQGTAALQ